MYDQFDRLVSFDSVHHAIRAENTLLEAGINVVALPTPREIDISCGQCLLFTAAYQAVIWDILRQQHIRWAKMFSRDARQRRYEQLAEYEGDEE
jgi:hypothetical protein